MEPVTTSRLHTRKADDCALGASEICYVCRETHLEEVGDYHGLEDVELEVPRRAADCDCNLISKDLGADHRECLALRWVHLARHDRRPWLILREGQLSKAASRAGSEESDVVRDLHEACRHGVERTVRLNEPVVGSEGFELVWCCDEGQPSLLQCDGRASARDNSATDRRLLSHAH